MELLVDDSPPKKRKAGDAVEGQTGRKMHGQLSRTVEQWHPAKQLCERFNSAHLYRDLSTVCQRKDKEETIETGAGILVELHMA